VVAVTLTKLLSHHTTPKKAVQSTAPANICIELIGDIKDLKYKESYTLLTPDLQGKVPYTTWQTDQVLGINAAFGNNPATLQKQSTAAATPISPQTSQWTYKVSNFGVNFTLTCFAVPENGKTLINGLDFQRLN